MSSAADSTFADFDPFDTAYLADPYPTLARIQAATPALRVEKGGGFYLVSRYADVVTTSKRHDIYSSTGGVGIEWQSRPMMPMYDPPQHTQLRRLVAPFFNPRAVQTYRTAIAAEVTEVIDLAVGRDAIDVVRDISQPISIATLATILGVPRERRDDLARWADNIMADLAGGAAPEDEPRIEQSRREFITYLRESVVARRKTEGEDLISVLLRANESERLTDKEVVAFCVLLLVAGFEPSASAVANICHAIATQLPDVAAIPSGEDGIASAVNELVRWDSPVHCFFRNTLADTQVGDVPIPKGSKVMIHFAAANRDPQVFEDPTVLDLRRSPNPHIAFGAGIHHCLGSALAHLQLSTFLQILSTRAARLEIAAPVTRNDNLLFHNLSRCVVRFVPR